MRSPLAFIQSSTLTVPLIEGPSSSPVIRNEIAPGMLPPRLVDELQRGDREAGDGALHVDGAATPQHAVLDHGGEGGMGPRLLVAGRDDIGMAGKAEVRAVGAERAEAGVEVVDVGRARLA